MKKLIASAILLLAFSIPLMADDPIPCGIPGDINSPPCVQTSSTSITDAILKFLGIK